VLLEVVVEPAVVLVVVGEGVDLGLRVAHLVDRLAQRREPRAGTVEVPGEVGEVAVGLVLQRRDALEEQLHRVEVGRLGQAEVALALGEPVEHGVEPLVLLRLVLRVGVDGEAEGVLPLAPVVDLDALELGVGEHVALGDVARLPVEVTGQRLIALLHGQLARGLGGDGHGAIPVCEVGVLAKYRSDEGAENFVG
jgi:hypothetical protein